jgi:parallel beta-helix repeat protein
MNRLHSVAFPCVAALIAVGAVAHPAIGGSIVRSQATSAVGTGLKAEYFDTVDFIGDPVKRVEPTIRFDWGDGSPDASLQPDTFSARFTGEIAAPASGKYTFYATADDGVRLAVGSQKVLDDWSDHPRRTTTGDVDLVAGQRVPVTLEYYEQGGQASLRLRWSGPGITRQDIPTANLFPANDVPPVTTVPVATVPVTTTPPTTSSPPPTSFDTFYVEITGDDRNPGTAALPFRTIQKAAGLLKPGQTVLVGDGTYANGIFFDAQSGEPGKPLTLKAAPGASPKVDITLKEDNGLRITASRYIHIEGFEFTYKGPLNKNGKDYEDGINVMADRVGNTSDHINIIANKVHGFPGVGIGAGQADYIRIEGNTVWGNAIWNEYDTSGISIYQSADADLLPGFHNIIRGNTIFQNYNAIKEIDAGFITDGNCIIIDDQRRRQNRVSNKSGAGSYESDTLIENNICAGNGGSGVRVYNSDNVLVRHNTLYDNVATPGIGSAELQATFYFDADDPAPSARQLPARRGSVRFVNNLVVSSSNKIGSLAATYIKDDDPDPAKRVFSTQEDRNSVTFEKNFYFGTSLGVFDLNSIASRSANDIVGNFMPLTAPNVFALGADFRLLPGSWAANNALPGNSPAYDLAGNLRPQGSGNDFGALEFVVR